MPRSDSIRFVFSSSPTKQALTDTVARFPNDSAPTKKAGEAKKPADVGKYNKNEPAKSLRCVRRADARENGQG
jgi:hypothetical protein